MNACNVFSEAFSQINWLWYAVAVVVVFGVGGAWYSALFSKTWIRIFKVEIPEKTPAGSMARIFGLQVLATALQGVVFFMLTNVSVCLSALTLIGFCGWGKANLGFQFCKIRDFITAAMINVGYTFVAGVVFILFALI